MKGKIYILKDPISKEIRYIGLTRVSLEHRLHLHLKENVKGLTHKINWIKSLKQQNLKPIIEEIDSSSDLEELCKKEIYWIQYYLKKGCKLTNTITTYSNKPYKDFKNYLPKKVIQYDLKGNKIAEFVSGYEAACLLGDCNANSIIYSILNNSKKYTYKGFTFIYEGELFENKEIIQRGKHITTKEHKEYLSLKAKERNSNRTSEYYKEIRKKVKPIVIVDITTNIEYNGILDAMSRLNKSRNYFWKHLKNKVNNPKFKYKDIVQSTLRYVGIKYLCSVRKNILYKMRSLVLQEGYEATIYILVVRNTVDEDWLKKVLQDFDIKNVEYISSKNYE